MRSQPIAFDVSRDLRALNISSSLKITLSMKEMGLVISLEGSREGGLVVKTENGSMIEQASFFHITACRLVV